MSDNIQFTKKALISLALLSLFLLLGALAWYSVQTLFLIFAGILIAIFIRGVAGFLFGRLLPLPEKAGILATLLILLTLFFAFFILLVPQLVEQGEELVQKLPEALKLLQEKTGLPPGWTGDILEKAQDSAALDSTGKIARRAMGLFATTLGAVTSLFIMLFVGLYLAFSPHYYRGGNPETLPGKLPQGSRSGPSGSGLYSSALAHRPVHRNAYNQCLHLHRAAAPTDSLQTHRSSFIFFFSA